MRLRSRPGRWTAKRLKDRPGSLWSGAMMRLATGSVFRPAGANSISAKVLTALGPMPRTALVSLYGCDEAPPASNQDESFPERTHRKEDHMPASVRHTVLLALAI